MAPTDQYRVGVRVDRLLALLCVALTCTVVLPSFAAVGTTVSLSTEACAQPELTPCNIWASRLPVGPANEVHIAVNPLNDQHVLVVAKDYGLGSNGDCANGGAYHVASASYVTFDAGATWHTARVPAPYPNGGAAPSPLPNKCGSDPVALFGPDGTAYYVVLNFHYTGGRQAAIAVARSPDGGLSWPAADIRILHTSPGDDKEWADVGPDGTVHVVWTDLSSGRILYSRSLPGWQFSAPIQLGSVGGGNPAVTVAAGLDAVHVLWRSSGQLWHRLSLDGGAAFAPAKLAVSAQPYESSGPPRLPFMPQIAVDKDPASPHAGSLYVVWPDARLGGSSVYGTFTRDDGATWAAPFRIDDRPLPQTLAVMPNIDVAPGGRVDVAWLDTRTSGLQTNQPFTFRAYATHSADGGADWAPNVMVSQVPLNPQWSFHQNGGLFIGDYMGVASTADHAWITFPGNGPERLNQGLALSDLDRVDAYVAAVAPVATGTQNATPHRMFDAGPPESIFTAGAAPMD